jgi:hypothetical protein
MCFEGLLPYGIFKAHSRLKDRHNRIIDDGIESGISSKVCDVLAFSHKITR